MLNLIFKLGEANGLYEKQRKTIILGLESLLSDAQIHLYKSSHSTPVKPITNTYEKSSQTISRDTLCQVSIGRLTTSSEVTKIRRF